MSCVLRDGRPPCQLPTFPHQIAQGVRSKFGGTHVVRFRFALGFFSDSTPSLGYAGSNRKDDSRDRLEESALLLRKLESPTSLAATVDAIFDRRGVRRRELRGVKWTRVWIQRIKDLYTHDTNNSLYTKGERKGKRNDAQASSRGEALS